MYTSHFQDGLGGRLVLALGTAVFALATPARGAAQQTDTTTAGAAAMPAATDSFTLLVPNRDTAEVKREISAAVQRRAKAENAVQQYGQLRNGTQLRVEDMKRRIDSLKDQSDVAKKERRDADRARLEAEQKAAERERELWERRVSLRDAEVAVEKKEVESAELERKALEVEMQLALKRNDPARPAIGTVNRASFDQVVADLERQVLEARRNAADKDADVASAEKSIMDRQLEILDAQENVVGGK